MIELQKIIWSRCLKEILANVAFWHHFLPIRCRQFLWLEISAVAFQKLFQLRSSFTSAERVWLLIKQLEGKIRDIVNCLVNLNSNFWKLASVIALSFSGFSFLFFSVCPPVSLSVYLCICCLSLWRNYFVSFSFFFCFSSSCSVVLKLEYYDGAITE